MMGGVRERFEALEKDQDTLVMDKGQATLDFAVGSTLLLVDLGSNSRRTLLMAFVKPMTNSSRPSSCL